MSAPSWNALDGVELEFLEPVSQANTGSIEPERAVLSTGTTPGSSRFVLDPELLRLSRPGIHRRPEEMTSQGERCVPTYR